MDVIDGGSHVTWEGELVQVGFMTDLRNPPRWKRPPSEHYGKMLELVEEADRLGAGAIFIGEHHLDVDGHCPQPLTFAAAVAARTKRIRIGTSVLLAPIRHPLHIAEEAAMVDILSNGRVELGLGAGYLPIDFTPFGAERSKRFRVLDAVIPEVRRLLDEEVMPRPVQQPLPIWAGYVGPVGARRAGLMGEGLLSAHQAFLQPYLDGLAAGGHDPSTAQMCAPMMELAIVSDDPERTRARAEPQLRHLAQLYIERRDDADRVESEDPGSNELTRGLQSMIAENQAKMEYLVMTPADAITHIKRATEGLPVKFILPWFAVNGVPDDIVEEHIRLMVTKVGPAIA